MNESHSLVLEQVTKTFETPEGRQVTAVDRVSLAIQQGAFVTLLGPSGCGKTTTLRLIAGFEFPTQGRILLDGRDIAQVPPNKREMAMVFQSYALFPHLTVYENVAYGLRLRHKSKAEIEQIVRETMALVNLSGLESRRPAALSGGQQQRVALARAMAIRPKVLLFDEPLSNLDAKLRVSLRSEIRQLQKRLGITSVYVTHDQSEAMSLSDSVVVMNAGRIEQASSPAAVYRRPANRFVADFIGRANFLDVRVSSVSGEQAEASLWDTAFRVPAHPAAVAGAGVMVLRPEAIRLVAPGGAGQASHFPGRIKSAAYLGNSVEYEVAANGLILNAVASESAWNRVFQEGDAVGWQFDPQHAYVLGPAGAAPA